MNREKNLQEIIDLMRRDDSTDAPEDSLRWASNLFRTRAARPRKTLIQKLSAVLEMEIKPNKPAFGERSSSPSQVRQMLYRAGENAIDLRIEPGKKKGFRIWGQILGEGFTGAWVKLFNDENIFAVGANENSEFSIDNLPADRYELLIKGDDAEITLKTIDIE